MKITLLDNLLIGITLTFMVVLSVGTVILIPLDNPYNAILNVIIGLIVYFLYTSLFLFILRKIIPLPIGTYDMDSWQFTYWKYVTVVSAMAEKAISFFETLFTKPIFFMFLGVKIGKNAAFPLKNTIRDHSLVHVGDMATLGEDSVITAHAITGETIEIAPVHIKENAVVGMNCVVMQGVCIGKNAVLTPGAVAIAGTIIPDNEVWGGIPAKKIK